MRIQFCTTVLMLSMFSGASAQVMASHAPTLQAPNSNLPPAQIAKPVVNDNPVVRVNGVALTNRDLAREMFAIFPYGQQHNGFPKGLEPEIRKGALDMIIFEELAYQEAERRKMDVPPVEVNKALAQYRKQFPNPKLYQDYLKYECKGSSQVLRAKIRRSLLIERLLKLEVSGKANVTTAQAKAYYDKHPQDYQYPESVSIQTISIIPPENSNSEVQKEAKNRADKAFGLAKATKSYREFGLLAEQMSDDDWHVNMGDHKEMDVAKLPPPIVEAVRKMKPGDVSELFKFGTSYAVFRLNAHTPAGKKPFEQVGKEVRSNMAKAQYNEARGALGQRLRKNAKVEIL